MEAVADQPSLIQRYARTALAASMLIMGACGIVYEYALGTLGNNLIGTSHEQIYVIIGLMMFAMGIGASSQRFITKHLIDGFLLVEVLLGLVGGTSVLLIYGAYAYLTSYQLLLYGIAGLIGFLIGLEIPLLIRINKTYEKQLSINLGNILCMDYVGSLIGALLFAFVFISRVPLEQIAIWLGLTNIVVAMLGAALFAPLLHAPRRLFAAMGLTVAILVAGFFASSDLMLRFEQRTYQDPIVFRATSPYQHVVLTKKNERLRMYINGQLQFDTTDEYRYHEMLVHMPMALARSRERVLILGGGDGLALREALRYGDVGRIDLVDLDPMITCLATEQPDLVAANQASLHDTRATVVEADGVQPGDELVVRRQSTLARWQWDQTTYRQATVRVLNVDADQFIRSVDDSYDVIIVDFPDPNSLEISKLYSLDFYRQLRRLMHADTLLSCQSGSPIMARSVFLCIGATLRAAGYEVLPYHHAVPSFGHWGWHLAGPAGTQPRLAGRLQALERLPTTTRHVTPELLRASTIFGRDELLADGIEISTRFKPVILDYFRRSWRQQP
jgi:spermidine synthase